MMTMKELDAKPFFDYAETTGCAIFRVQRVGGQYVQWGRYTVEELFASLYLPGHRSIPIPEIKKGIAAAMLARQISHVAIDAMVQEMDDDCMFPEPDPAKGPPLP